MMRGFTLQRRAACALRSTLQTTARPALCPIALTSTTLPTRTPPTRLSIHTSPARGKGQDSVPLERPATDFSSLDVLGNTPAPSTSVDVCTYDGFGLNSGVTIGGGDGALLVSGEAFSWRPWEAIGEKKLLNKKGQFEIPKEAFGVLDVLWPRPGMFCWTPFPLQESICYSIMVPRLIDD